MAFLKRGSLALLVLVTLLLALGGIGLLLPRHYQAEKQIVIQAPAEIIFPYLIKPEKLLLWSSYAVKPLTMSPIDRAPNAAQAGLEVHAEFQLAHRKAKGQLRLQPTANGVHLTASLQGDAKYNLISRYGNHNLEREINRHFENDLAILKGLAEADAKILAAQKAAAADSVSHVPLDTVSTEVQTAE
jgi:hypothetical protein